jgi:hypothetical protein
MDWTSLEKFHKKPPTYTLSRKPHIQSAYQRCNLLLNFPNIIKNGPYKFYNTVYYAMNHFPYDMKDEEIIHCVAWCKDTSIEHNQKLIEQDLLTCGITSAVFFTNPPASQSIPSIPHTHIFLKSLEDFIKLTTHSR